MGRPMTAPATPPPPPRPHSPPPSAPASFPMGVYIPGRSPFRVVPERGDPADHRATYMERLAKGLTLLAFGIFCAGLGAALCMGAGG